MRNYETAYYEAVLSDSNNVEQWEEDGSKDTARRAYERWNQLLKDYEAPPPIITTFACVCTSISSQFLDLAVIYSINTRRQEFQPYALPRKPVTPHLSPDRAVALRSL